MRVPQVRSGFTHNEKDFLYVLRQREPSTPNSPNTYTVYMNYERCVAVPCVLPHVCWITRVLNGTAVTVPTAPSFCPACFRVRSLRSSSLKDYMRRQDELERDKLRIEEQKRAALLAIETRERQLVKDRERALLAEQVRTYTAVEGCFG